MSKEELYEFSHLEMYQLRHSPVIGQIFRPKSNLSQPTQNTPANDKSGENFMRRLSG